MKIAICAPSSANMNAFLAGVRAATVKISRDRGGAQEPLLLGSADAGNAPTY